MEKERRKEIKKEIEWIKEQIQNNKWSNQSLQEDIDNLREELKNE